MPPQNLAPSNKDLVGTHHPIDLLNQVKIWFGPMPNHIKQRLHFSLLVNPGLKIRLIWAPDYLDPESRTDIETFSQQLKFELLDIDDIEPKSDNEKELLEIAHLELWQYFYHLKSGNLAAASDAVRLLGQLYENHAYYTDTDYILMDPISEDKRYTTLPHGFTCFLERGEGGGLTVSNNLLATHPQHLFLKDYQEALINKYYNYLYAYTNDRTPRSSNASLKEITYLIEQCFREDVSEVFSKRNQHVFNSVMSMSGPDLICDIYHQWQTSPEETKSTFTLTPCDSILNTHFNESDMSWSESAILYTSTKNHKFLADEDFIFSQLIQGRLQVIRHYEAIRGKPFIPSADLLIDLTKALIPQALAQTLACMNIANLEKRYHLMRQVAMTMLQNRKISDDCFLLDNYFNFLFLLKLSNHLPVLNCFILSNNKAKKELPAAHGTSISEIIADYEHVYHNNPAIIVSLLLLIDGLDNIKLTELQYKKLAQYKDQVTNYLLSPEGSQRFDIVKEKTLSIHDNPIKHFFFVKRGFLHPAYDAGSIHKLLNTRCLHSFTLKGP